MLLHDMMFLITAYSNSYCQIQITLMKCVFWYQVNHFSSYWVTTYDKKVFMWHKTHQRTASSTQVEKHWLKSYINMRQFLTILKNASTPNSAPLSLPLPLKPWMIIFTGSWKSKSESNMDCCPSPLKIICASSVFNVVAWFVMVPFLWVKSRNVVPTLSGDSGNFLRGEIFLDTVKQPTSSGMREQVVY